MNKLNVFRNPKYPLTSFHNVKITVKMFFHSCKYAYQRVTRGYADCDLWDLDDYYLTLFTNTLNSFADNTISYPGNKQFPSYESWIKYVRELALDFLKANEANDFFNHPKEDIWWEQAQQGEPTKEAVHDMVNESNAIAQMRERSLHKGLDKFKDNFYHLWD